MLRTASILLVALASSAFAQVAPPTAETANDTLDRLAAQLSAMQRELGSEGAESIEPDNTPNEAARQWLDRTRPIAEELQRVTARLRPRALDLSQGFRLVLPHLSGLRGASRTLGSLAYDAMRRGDMPSMVAMLRAQRDIVMHTASDGVTISSIVAMSQAGLAHGTLEVAIDRGLFDRDTAAQALAYARELGDGANYGLTSAMRSESSAMLGELAKLEAAPEADRLGLLGEIGVSDTPPPGVDLTSDAALAQARTETAAYFQSAEAAMANPDREAGGEALLALDAWIHADGRSPLLRVVAPALIRVHERLAKLEADYATIESRLEALANGSRTAADFTNAAPHYLAAAKIMAALDVESQQQIEAARLAGAELALEDRMRARRIVDALRERVIDRLLAGATCGRCEFEKDEWPTLLSQGVIGANGAARLLLADPLVPGDRGKAHSRADAVVAVLSMSRHYASAGGFGRAIASHELARDAQRELSALIDAKLLADEDRARIDAMLARFSAEDPFGYRAAGTYDRAMLSSGSGGFRAQSIRGLAPNTIVFLVALWTSGHAATAPQPCECPHDGPLLSIRTWFDPNALIEARTQLRAMRDRPDDSGPLDGLRVTVPVDIDGRTAQGDADFARLLESVARAAAQP
jgi:hypothetical protein